MKVKRKPIGNIFVGRRNSKNSYVFRQHKFKNSIHLEFIINDIGFSRKPNYTIKL